VSRAQDYCRQVADHVTREGGAARLQPDFLPDFLHQLLNLSERLKYQVGSMSCHPLWGNSVLMDFQVAVAVVRKAKIPFLLYGGVK